MNFILAWILIGLNNIIMTYTPESQLDLRARHPDFQVFLDINEKESERVRKSANYTSPNPSLPSVIAVSIACSKPLKLSCSGMHIMLKHV